MSTNITDHKHPKGLKYLFGTELWERFGFYVIQGLLILYLTQGRGLGDDQSNAILSSFTAISYILPIAGGFLADRVLGYRHSVIFGGLLFVIGYAGLALPEGREALSWYFYVSLGFIALGNAFFKPNVSSLLGALYKKGDFRRDSGFTLFYVGINLGGLIANISSGLMKEFFGWHLSFAVASVGLVLGVLTFIVGFKAFKGAGKAPEFSSESKRWFYIFGIYLATVACIGAVYELVRIPGLADQLMIWVVLAVLVVVLITAFGHQPHQRNKMLACLLLIIISIVFWALLFQIFFSLTLFNSRLVDRHIFSFTIPTPAFTGLENMGIIIFGPLLSSCWFWLEDRGFNPSTPMKFAIGLFFLVLMFVTLWLSVLFLPQTGLVTPLVILVAYLFLALGELTLSPVGLSMVTTLSPPKYIGMMMGVWFVAIGIGGKLAGNIADFAAIPKGASRELTVSIYQHALLMDACIALAATIVVLLLVPIIKRLMVENMAGGSV